MGIESINEPGTSRITMVTPVSINEPPHLPADAIAPVIEGIAPETCVIGDADFTLVVTGENFFPGSIIHFAGHDEPTTQNEDGTLSTGVKPSLWQSPVTVQCQVRNGSLMSNAVDFTFDPAGAGTTAAKHEHAHHAATVDPDELEEELEEAEEEGDFKPMHKAKPKRKK